MVFPWLASYDTAGIDVTEERLGKLLLAGQAKQLQLHSRQSNYNCIHHSGTEDTEKAHASESTEAGAVSRKIEVQIILETASGKALNR
jgi:hypothetical protein